MRVHILGQCEISLLNLTSTTPLEIWIPLNSEMRKVVEKEQQQQQNNNLTNENLKLTSMMMLYARVEYKENNY